MSNSAFTPIAYPQVGGDGLPGMAAERARGYAEGYAEGLRRAAATLDTTDSARAHLAATSLASGEAQVAQALSALGRALSALDARVAPVVQDADDALIAASLDLAEAIIGREVGDTRTAAEDALRRALSRLDGQQAATIALNPADAELLAGETLPARVTLTADRSVGPGDAIVLFDDGWLDARIGTALARAKEIMTGDRR
jgi:flagellar assembly protein FliH